MTIVPAAPSIPELKSEAIGLGEVGVVAEAFEMRLTNLGWGLTEINRSSSVEGDKWFSLEPGSERGTRKEETMLKVKKNTVMITKVELSS